jgi:hypothetical protein
MSRPLDERQESGPTDAAFSTESKFQDRELNPVAGARFTGVAGSPVVAAGAYEGEEVRREYEEFAANFHHRPGVRLMEYIQENQDERLLSWLDWRCPEPEPKAFIRLMLAMMRAGSDIWDQPGISFFFQGRWSRGGEPSQRSQDRLSVISQIIGKPISVIYEIKPQPPVPQASTRVLRFEP